MEDMFNQLLQQMKELTEQLQKQSIQLQQQNEQLSELQKVIGARRHMSNSLVHPRTTGD